MSLTAILCAPGHHVSSKVVRKQPSKFRWNYSDESHWRIVKMVTSSSVYNKYKLRWVCIRLERDRPNLSFRRHFIDLTEIRREDCLHMVIHHTTNCSRIRLSRYAWSCPSYQRASPRRKSTPKQSADRVHKIGHFPWTDEHIKWVDS